MSTAPKPGSLEGNMHGSARDGRAAIDLKGSVFTLTVLRVNSANLTHIESELRERIAQGPRFFDNAPVVIDVENLKSETEDFDLGSFLDLLKRVKLIPVGVRHANTNIQEQALQAGVAVMKGGSIRELPTLTQAAEARTGDAAANLRKAAARAGAASEKPEAKPKLQTTTAATTETSPRPSTKTASQPIRSGQQIYAPGGDLIVLAAINAGAEVVADGNIHIYAPLRGRALAGVRGDSKARIFCHSFEAELISVAGNYRVFEDKVPAELYRKPVQIYLNDKDQLTIEPLS